MFCGAVVFELSLFWAISSSLLILSGALLVPGLGILFFGSLLFALLLSLKFSLWVLLSGAFLSWALVTPTMKCLAVIPLLPSSACLCCIVLSIALYPLKDSLHKFLGSFIHRFIEHETGPVAAITTAVGLVAALVQQFSQH